MLADISQTLRDLIYSRAKLEMRDVDISFEAPTKEWVGSRTKPAINFFLYDLEENTELRRTAMELMPVRSGASGNSIGVRRTPPRRFNLHYMVSAISTVVEDEHHLLWRVMSALLKNPTLPSRLYRPPSKNSFWASSRNLRSVFSVMDAINLICSPLAG